MTRGFQRGFPSYSAQFGQRGIGQGGIQSGVMQKAMGNYLGDYQREFSRGTQDLTEELRQFDLQRTQLTSDRNSALADIKMAKAKEIAFAAQNIEALKQILGGL
jgi:cell division septum initiation protein DivIVA